MSNFQFILVKLHIMAARQTPLTCSGHTRPVVDLAYSALTPDGFFLISACKGKGGTGTMGVCKIYIILFASFIYLFTSLFIIELIVYASSPRPRVGTPFVKVPLARFKIPFRMFV